MLFYFDDLNSKAIKSLIEYDYIKKLPPQYTFNLLTKDKRSNKKDKEDINKKNNNSQISSNVNNIQRELINLLSYDYEQNSINEEFQKDQNQEINEEEFIIENNISNLNDNININSSLMNGIRYMNNTLQNNNENNNNSNNINSQMHFNMKFHQIV
jgi:hypothetical protein